MKFIFSIINSFLIIVGLIYGYNAYKESQKDKLVAKAMEQYGDKYYARERQVIANSIIEQVKNRDGKDGDYILIKNNDIIPLECEIRICFGTDCASTDLSISGRDEATYPVFLNRMANKFKFDRGTTFDLIYQGESIKKFIWQ